jgi:aldose 1-epimerase
MTMDEAPFGEVAGRPARAFRLDGGAGVTARVTDYGARLTELHVPGRDGRTEDIVLGFDDAAPYATSSAYFGATVGRFANRIREGRFRLRGHDYQVDRNEGPNHLHGGREGWDRRPWDAEAAADGRSIVFRTASADGEMGFPGAVDVRSSYELDGTTLRIVLEAVPDATTVINMVNHSYFNLAGHASGRVLAQELRLDADHYLPVDADLLPTGEVRAVAGTAFDFRDRHPIGLHLDSLEAPAVGWDHNWCLRGMPDEDGLTTAAEVRDPGSGRTLRLRTTEPGVQVYTGGYLDGSALGKGGHRYGQFAGFTLETQTFPDGPNQRHFPSPVVEPGETYHHEMVIELGWDG